MSVGVMKHDGSWDYHEDEQFLIYERVIGQNGELYIIAHNPQEADLDAANVRFGGRYVTVVYSPSGWVKVEGIKADADPNMLPVVGP